MINGMNKIADARYLVGSLSKPLLLLRTAGYRKKGKSARVLPSKDAASRSINSGHFSTFSA
jgi:hypothetical protein